MIPQAARDFYARTLGWAVRVDADGGRRRAYLIAKVGDRMVPAASLLKPGNPPPGPGAAALVRLYRGRRRRRPRGGGAAGRRHP